MKLRSVSHEKTTLMKVIILALVVMVLELVLRLSDTSNDDFGISFLNDGHPIWNHDSLLNHNHDSRPDIRLHRKAGTSGWDPNNPLAIPYGQAAALPSIRVEGTTDSVDEMRFDYGGKGDKKHLGGFTTIDTDGISPTVWKYMISKLGIHSVLDVGCGRGISTSWFQMHGCDILCVEGSHDAVVTNVLPDIPNQVVEHDFSRGPWWPEKTYDAVWAVEFLEHVGIQYHFNYVTSFRKAALIFVTSSRWGGWHHVEVHNDDWWIRKYEAYGFKFDDFLTKKIRSLAVEEIVDKNSTAPNGQPYAAHHIANRMKVFVNPVVAALPQHAHLFPEHGCFEERGKNRICGTGRLGHLETPLPEQYWPLDINPKMDILWENYIKEHISQQVAVKS